MSTIILDCGFGAQCKNDPTIIKKMIYAIKEIDSDRHKIIFKWQLFKKEIIPNLEPLTYDNFSLAYHVANKLGYETTSSVFDEDSLEFLELFKVPWIKIAARPELHTKLLPKVTKKIVASVKHPHDFALTRKHDIVENIICYLHCIAKYPATIEEYETVWDMSELQHSISDHTIGLKLFKKYKPLWWEKHYLLEREPIDDPFGNDWYATADELKEIL
jgi:sialic acid synthase SpsE